MLFVPCNVAFRFAIAALNDCRTAQRLDLCRIVACLGQDRLDVGAEGRSHAVEPSASMGKLEAIANKAQVAVRGLYRLHRLAGVKLWMVDDLFHLPDAC